VSCLSSFLPSNEEDLEMIDRSNFHHHHEGSYSINWGEKQDKTKTNKQTYVNFEKTYVIILLCATA
jgi:hypothetical protein